MAYIKYIALLESYTFFLKKPNIFLYNDFMKNRFLLSLCFVGLACGIFFLEIFDIFSLDLRFLVIFLLLFLYKPKKYFLVYIFLFLGIGRAFLDIHEPNHSSIDYYIDGKKAKIEASVCEMPQRAIDKQKVVVCADKINDYEIDSKILINTNAFLELDYGDRVDIYGVVKEPFENEDFSYKKFLAKDEIYGVMYYPNVQIVYKNHSFLSYLLRFKDKMSDGLELIPYPNSAFLQAVLLGEKNNLPDNRLDMLRKSGIAHIVALSGFHVSILIAGLFAVLSFLPKRVNMLISSVFVVLFCVMVGSTASVIRAGIMGVLALWILHSGRNRHSVFLLLLASFFMLMWNTKILLYDIGFQFSFLGVLGICIFNSIFSRFDFFKKMPNWFGLRDIFVITISAQIMILPLSVFHFKGFSMVGPLVNPLLSFLLPFLMGGGVLLVLTSFFTPLAKFIGFFVNIGVSLFFGVIEFFSGLPFAYVQIENSYFLIFNFVLIFGILIWKRGILRKLI